ncbi:MAG: glycosyl transferase, family 2 [Frankiales bacterium]|nr:glycosyl transferase, family 2 [Frankiales bacterium]
MRVRVDGKQFALGADRFAFRGVTYGTFAPRAPDGARFPESDQLKKDLAAIADNGFTVLRTYTSPPDDLLDLAGEFDLKVMAGIFWPDWRYLVGNAGSDLRRVSREARDEVRREARRLAGRDEVLALALGNEVPADVLRWYGTQRIARKLDELVDVVRHEDADALVTYANYPTAEYLPLPGLDFLTFNVFLEHTQDLRRYVTRLHHLAGDRPLVLGEMGLHVADRNGAGQARLLHKQLEVAVERGVAGTCVFAWTDEWQVGDVPVSDWRFGLTTSDREPRPALKICRTWNGRTVRDLDFKWPSMTVVVCAYNASATVEECLTHTRALDYPRLEVLLIDDGSTDDTADIAERVCAGDPRMRVVRAAHQGLSGARNTGWQTATGDLVVYLDSDAYPTPEWPYYLALGLDAADVGGVGGPNLPPPGGNLASEKVARAPGGPVHVLLSDDRAEHIPGANMAFWRKVLEEVGGFDVVYTAAGDDVDLCWKVLDKDWEIAFHPAALVWHHRRDSTKAYLKQQRGYGRSESLVARRHPDRFTSLGTARWHGRIYDSFAPSLLRQRVYRGLYGAAAYQSVYGAGGHAIDIAHQLGVPLATLSLLLALPAIAVPELAVVPALGLALLLGLFLYDAKVVRPPRRLGRRALGFRFGVAFLHLAQPLVRTRARWREDRLSRRRPPAYAGLQGPVTRLAGGVLLLPEERPRAQIAADLVGDLRRAGFAVAVPSGWEDHDATLVGSWLILGELVTSSHPVGCVQLRVRRTLRTARLLCAAAVVAFLALLVPLSAPIGLLAIAADLARGWWRTGRLVRFVVEEAAQ